MNPCYFRPGTEHDLCRHRLVWRRRKTLYVHRPSHRMHLCSHRHGALIPFRLVSNTIQYLHIQPKCFS